ncbi:MAG: FAD-dependent oxidoreductase [Gammaproteobacteria bacterium]
MTEIPPPSAAAPPAHAGAVVIGGGVVGASVAYHLAKSGIRDVVLLERRRFACGTSWHAAGLIGVMRADPVLANLVRYGIGLLGELEAETGQSTGYRQVGSLSLAPSEARLAELQRLAAMNNGFGAARVEMISAAAAQSRFPLLSADGLLGAAWIADDGVASPVDVTNAFLRGARMRGAQCFENTAVSGIEQHAGRVRGVRTAPGGFIRADLVINCAGIWARDVGAMAGANIPLQACEHYYALTEKRADIPRDLPSMRDQDGCAYYREDAGSLLVGAFERTARPWGMDGIPDDFCFDEIDGDFEAQLMPVLSGAMRRIPMLRETGWRKFFCGPESFTADDQFHIGETPEVKNFFVACGLNSIGIQSAAGIGLALAEWVELGQAPRDLSGNDIRRVFDFQGTRRYRRERAAETLGLLFARHYPHRQFASARDVRHSPLHERLRARGACFGETAGWERANWFAPPGVEPRYEYSFGKQNWFAHSAAEHRATREQLALYDLSSLAKYGVRGRDSCAVLQRICSADIDIAPGRMVYTHWLNARGGIEAEVTVMRLSEEEFFLVGAAAAVTRDLHWLKAHMPPNAHCLVTDRTNSGAALGVMGPRSRAFLQDALGADLSAFAFGDVREVEVGAARALAARVSFAGELGWEIYVAVEQARHAFDFLCEHGGSELTLAGMHALDSCRIEKKFLHYGDDISACDTPLECGAAFVCALDKAARFIGRDAILAQLDSGVRRQKRLVQFLLAEPEALLYQHEPILREGEVVGHLTSGAYGHTLGGAVGLGYVRDPDGVTEDYLAADFAVDIGGEIIPAKPSLRALYDPSGARMRG